MKKLVKVVNGVPVVTLNDVIEFSGNTSKSTKDVILKYEKEITSPALSKLEVGSYSAKLPRSASGVNVNWSRVEFNYEQAMFVLTLMRNTKEVVKFKLRLIEEFSNMKEALQTKMLEAKDKEIAQIKSERKLCNTYTIDGKEFSSCRGVAQRSNLKERDIKPIFEKLGYIQEELVLTRFWRPTDKGLVDGIITIDSKGTPIYNINETIDVVNQYNNLED